MASNRPHIRTSTATPATSDAPSVAPWKLPKKPSNPSHAAECHVLANAEIPRAVRVCYVDGPPESHIGARAITFGKENIATNIHLGACADLGGTEIELTNPNDAPVSGTYSVLAIDKKDKQG
jgi:hypothetical protein